MVSLLHDIRFGLRLAARYPGSSALVILILAVGIGASTALFSAVLGVIVKPLPFECTDRPAHVGVELQSRNSARAPRHVDPRPPHPGARAVAGWCAS